MTKKISQNAQVYKEITESGKSLLQLYLEVRKRCEGLEEELKNRPRADQQEDNPNPYYV